MILQAKLFLIASVLVLHTFLMITIGNCPKYFQYLVISLAVNMNCFAAIEINSMQTEIKSQLTYRLPKEVAPVLYELYIHPDLDGTTFSGSEKIHINVTKPVKFIVLHASKLVISETRLYEENGSEYININTFEHRPFEYWVIVPTTEISVGQYVVELKFNGNYANRIVSLYGSTYYDKKSNQSSKIVTSKYQPTYTRQAFPCFDEPGIKAQFEVTLVRPADKYYHALSNMNVVSEKIYPGNDQLTVVKFARSVPMTAYLLCFIISNFDSREYRIPSNGVGQDVYMRVFSAPNEINKTTFSGDLGFRVIQYYLKYFDIEYPLPKLDMVAIPDYISEATENWGLVALREGLFLYDPKVASSDSKQYTMVLIVHELAHMWFGNLVTIDWWDELWLNEGFASYMEFKCGNIMYPEYKMLDQMIIETQNVLAIDSTVASYPIVQSVVNADEINEIFNPITYMKAAAVIRMLEDFVGEEHFRTSISNFLKTYQYSVANSKSLIYEIEKVIPNIEVKSFLSTWIHQKGFPYVKVQNTSETNVYKLTQHRFLIGNGNIENDTKSEYNYKWDILLTYFTNVSPANKITRMLFPFKNDSLAITVEENHAWIKLNKDRVGFYRVLYSYDIWYSLIKELKSNPNAFSVSDRASLIDDAFSLAEAKLLSYDIPLELIKYLENEKDFVPWSIASLKLGRILGVLDSIEIKSKLKSFIAKVIDPVYEYVGWDIESGDEFHIKNRLRAVVLELACNVDHDKCLKRVEQEFLTFLINPFKRPHPDIRRIVYYYGIVKTNSPDIWNSMWQLLVLEHESQEQNKLMYGLCGIQNSTILQNLLELMKTEKEVFRDHDYFTYLEHIASNKFGEPLVWNAIQNDWEYLVNRFTLNSRYLGRAVGNVLSKFNTVDKYDEVLDFFKIKPDAGAGTASRIRAVENIKNNIDWLGRNSGVLLQWLNRNA